MLGKFNFPILSLRRLDFGSRNDLWLVNWFNNPINDGILPIEVQELRLLDLSNYHY